MNVCRHRHISSTDFQESEPSSRLEENANSEEFKSVRVENATGRMVVVHMQYFNLRHSFGAF